VAGRASTLTTALIAGCIVADAGQRCTAVMLKGQYIFTGRGNLASGDPRVEHVHYGVFVFDGAGNLSGMQTSSRGGEVRRREAIKGTYVLSPDCTGTVTFDDRFRVGGEIHWDLFVTRDGRKGNMIRTDPGAMAVRSFEK